MRRVDSKRFPTMSYINIKLVALRKNSIVNVLISHSIFNLFFQRFQMFRIWSYEMWISVSFCKIPVLNLFIFKNSKWLLSLWKCCHITYFLQNKLCHINNFLQNKLANAFQHILVIKTFQIFPNLRNFFNAKFKKDRK